MIFSFQQIQDVLAILKQHQFVFIAEQLGSNFLTAQEISTLAAAGIDVNKFANSLGIIDHAFMFGVLADAIGDQRAAQMDYNQFKKFLKSGNFVPLTEEEELALQQVKTRAYTDIVGLGNRVAQGTSNVIIRSSMQTQNAIRSTIKSKAETAVQLRQSATKLASEIGHAVGDWERDWLRISAYIMHEAYNYGRAQNIFKNYGEDAEVYFDVYEDACRRCKELYLTDPDMDGSEPKVFKLKDVLANGNNIGRKVDEWLPTVGPTHPYCRCTINYKQPGFDWDAHDRAFTKPHKYVPKNKKLHGVKLNIKVSK